MIRHFLEKSGADMQLFYALESQLMQLIAITSTQTSLGISFPSPLLSTEPSYLLNL